MTAPKAAGFLVTLALLDSSGIVYPLMGDVNGNLFAAIKELPAIDQLPLVLDSDRLKVVLSGSQPNLNANILTLPTIGQLPSTLDTDRLKIVLSGTQPTLTVTGATGSWFDPQVVGGSYSNTSLAAGDSNHDVITVTAGQKWLIQAVAMDYKGTVAGVKLRLIKHQGGSDQYVAEFDNLTSDKFVTYSSPFITDGNSTIRVRVIGATLNDDIFIYVHGMRIK